MSVKSGEDHIVKKLKRLKLSERLKKLIKSKGQVSAKKTVYLKSLRDLITIFGSISIISTNYDIVIEQFCNVEKLKYEDGFGNLFEPDRLEKKDTQIKLYKIHGSILWYRSNTGAFYKVPIKSDKIIQTVFGEKLEPLLLYPIRKWEYVEPMFEFISKAKKIMLNKDIKLIYVFGYSFRDDHVRDIFFDIFRERTDLHMVLVDPNAYGIYKDKLRYYDKERNIASSIAGRVICKPTTIEVELESFYNASLKPTIEAIHKLNEFREESAKWGNEGWSSPAYHLIKCNYLFEFDKLRDKNEIISMNISFWELIKISLIYIANQIVRDDVRRMFWGLDGLIFLLDSYVKSIDLEKRNEKFGIEINYFNGNSRSRRPYTFDEIKLLRGNFKEFWKNITEEFQIHRRHGTNSWQYNLSVEISTLANTLNNSFLRITGVRTHIIKPQSSIEIQRAVINLLKSKLIVYTDDPDGNKAKERIFEYFNIVFEKSIENIQDILIRAKHTIPDGLTMFYNPKDI